MRQTNDFRIKFDIFSVRCNLGINSSISIRYKGIFMIFIDTIYYLHNVLNQNFSYIGSLVFEQTNNFKLELLFFLVLGLVLLFEIFEKVLVSLLDIHGLEIDPRQ